MSGSLPYSTVTNEAQLNADIAAADTITAGGTYVINFGTTITEGDGSIPAVTLGTTTSGTVVTAVPDLTAVNLHSGVSLVINGAGFSLNGANTYRGLFVYGGTVTINNLTIENAVATGGAGGGNAVFTGGGGAGLGGGLFVGGTASVASVTLNQVYFSNDKAVGGAGGQSLKGHLGYTGGGGLGGAGGGYSYPSIYSASGGGGIGRTAVGGLSSVNWHMAAGTGSVPGAAAGGTGGSGSNTEGFPSSVPGGINGGGGGYGFTGNPLGGPGEGYGGAGGGGIGGGAGTVGAQGSHYGKGGIGGWGGGGGGGFSNGGNGGFAGGGGAGFLAGGTGGWGGGSGGGAAAGGFGGGGGGGVTGYAGSQYNGHYASYYGGAGGGGLGAGGDVFVYKGSSLTIQSGTLSGGSVQGGAGGLGTTDHFGSTAGSAGSAVGSGIFLYGNNQTATFTPGVGQSVTVADQIVDQAGVGNGTNSGKVLLNGAGELILSNSNSFTGGATIQGGTLNLAHSGAAGSGAMVFSGFGRLLIQGVAMTGAHFANTVSHMVAGDVLDLAGLAYHSGASASVAGSTLTVVSNTTTNTLTLSASASTFAVGQDSTGGTAVIDSTFTITSTTDLANDLLAINSGGVDALSNAPYVFDFINSFAIASTQTINLDSGSSVTFNGGNATTGGGYEIAAGTLIAGAAGAIGSGAITADSGGTLNLNNFAQTIGDLSGAGAVLLGSATLTEGTANSTTVSGAISGTGALVKQGNGTLTLTGADSYSGATTITAGTLQLGNGGSTGSIANTSGVTDNGRLAFDQSGNVSFATAISGSGAVVQQGSGTLTLGFAGNSYSGGTTIDAGVLAVSADAALGSGGGVTLAGATLQWTEGSTATASARTVTLSGGGSIAATGSGLVTLSGNVTGTGALTLSGPLTLTGSLSQSGGLVVSAGSATLNGADSFAGGTTLQSGSLVIGSSATLNATGAVVVNGGTFNLNGNSTTIGDLSGTGGSVALGTGTLTVGTSGSTSFAGAISGSGALVKQGTGTLLLSGGNAIGGAITLQAGTLELGSSAAIGSGTIDFATPSASLRIDGNAAPSNVISRFVAGDTIDLHGIAYNAGDVLNYTTATGELDIINSGSTVAALFFGAGNTLVNDPFHIAQESGGTGIAVTNDVPCFLRGTLIRTDRGEVPVETLTVGQLVETLTGETRPIAWIGIGRMLMTRGRRGAATPIVLRKGALADNVPHHDLWVTKGHCFFLDDVLIPAEFLVNHRSIQWDDRAQEVEYYHIETDRHDVLLANGAPAETYRDDGNRELFHNANTGWDQPPKPQCAPVLTGGAVVDAVWRRLLERAGPRSALPLTEDPDLHLIADGQRIDAAERREDEYVFRLPRCPASLRIVSRDAVPAELGLVRDARSLGIALRRVLVRRGARLKLYEASDPRLVRGFHGFEQDAGAPDQTSGIRWTDGDAELPAAFLADFREGFDLVLQLGGRTNYIDDGAAERAA